MAAFTSTTLFIGVLGTVSSTSAPIAHAATQLTQGVGFNARTWTLTQPDANGIRYIGGDFTSFNAWQTGRGGWTDPVTGAVDPSFGAVTGGDVFAAVADGSGGVFLAGSFNTVAGTSRNRVAHVLADGTLDSTFVPGSINNEVWTIAADSTAIYIGGKFTQVAGVARNFVAALDRTTGALVNWNPNASSWVHALMVDGSTVYIGGRFSTLSGTGRVQAGAVRTDARTAPAAGTCLDNFDASDCLTAFNPPITSGYGVFDFAKVDSNIYIGGSFTASSGATTINTLVRTDSTGALDTGWNPGFAGNTTTGVSTPSNPAGPTVYAMDVDNSTLYVGGKFTTVNASPRARLAAFDLVTGSLTGWAPTSSAGGSYNSNNNIELMDAVSSLDVKAGVVYVGGGFFALNGVARNRVGAIDAATGINTAWDPHACDASNGVATHVRTVVALDSRVFTGGSFDCMGGLKRYHAAAVGPDGILTSWAPEINASVQSMSSDGSTVYMVGKFTSVNNATRQYAAAVTTSGTVTNWNPVLSVGQCGGGEKQTVLQTADKVYVGGCFTTVGGTPRVAVAATDRETGALDLNFDASVAPGDVRSLAVSGSRLYLGGAFTTVGGQSRNWIAAVDKATGALDTNWNSGGLAAAWDAGVRKAVHAMEVSESDGRLYIGGWFGTVGAETQRYLAALDLTTGALVTSWRPQIGTASAGGVFTLDVYGGKVYFGGSSNTPVSGTAFGVASIDDGSVSTWMNGSGTGEIRGITASDAAAFIAGNFTSVSDQGRGNTAAIGLDGSVMDPWPMDEAEYEPLTVTITRLRPLSDGQVVSNPVGIACGDACSYGFSANSTVTLTAVPEAAAEFSGWGGSCSGARTTCTVTMLAARSAVAAFAPLGSGLTYSEGAPPASGSSSSGGAAEQVSVRPSTSTVLSAPVGVSAVAESRSAMVTWAPVTDTKSPTLTYRVTAAPGGVTCVTTANSCRVLNLNNGTAYSFTVAVQNTAGWSRESERSNVVTPRDEAQPTIAIQGMKRVEMGKKRDQVVITGTFANLPPSATLLASAKINGKRFTTMDKPAEIGVNNIFVWTYSVPRDESISVRLLVPGVARSNTVTLKPRDA